VTTEAAVDDALERRGNGPTSPLTVGRHPGEQAVEQHAHRHDVVGRIEPIVGPRRVDLRIGGGLGLPGEVEPDQLDGQTLAAAGHEHGPGGHVAVHHAGRVRRSQAVRHLHADVQRLRRWDAPAHGQDVGHQLAGEQLGDGVEDAVRRLPHVQQTRHVGMLDLTGAAELLPAPVAQRGPIGII
jgi:hypothetical protein